jgi:hypothetical protein
MTERRAYLTLRDLEWAVLDLADQEVVVVLQGEDVLQIEGNRSEEGDFPPIPDPVATFVEVANHGMLTSAETPPWLSGAELIDRNLDRELRRQTWRVRLRRTDRRAFRILANLLLARTPEHASISTTTFGGVAARRLNLSELRYPAPFHAAPPAFPVDYEMPSRSSRDRFLQISFVHAPRTADLEAICRGLDLWGRLPMLGGYPADEMVPWQSAAVPDAAFLLDPTTVEQAFPDVFRCDDDCYAAVINWAHVVDHSMCPVAGVLLR